MQGGRLSGAVGAHQADDLPGQNLKGEVLDCGQVAVHFVQTLDVDH
jgi:hypothetical protein